MALAELGTFALPAPLRAAGFATPEEWLQECRRALASALDGHIVIDGQPVLAAGDFDARFWHVATTAVSWSTQRQLAPDRCAIMTQIGDVLERLAAGDPRAVSWHERYDRRRRPGKGRRSAERLMLAPLDFSFVATLREGRDAVYFGTAWALDGLGRQRAMRRAAGGGLLPLPGPGAWITAEILRSSRPIAAD
jgi:hypothetical protein